MEERGKLELTSLEIAIQDILDSLGISYVPQYSTRSGFVIDFALLDGKIAVEVDGPCHESSRRKDAFRDHILRREGWKVIRIDYTDIDKAKDILTEVKHGTN